MVGVDVFGCGGAQDGGDVGTDQVAEDGLLLFCREAVQALGQCGFGVCGEVVVGVASGGGVDEVGEQCR